MRAGNDDRAQALRDLSHAHDRRPRPAALGGFSPPWMFSRTGSNRSCVSWT
ncbi:hypothetical protein [Streptosporangium roseum]|uniref:hypothetical protein n=1 Tax=Streptosporangium roseum TaxID=2001 RepID=UPI00331DEC3D